MPTAAKSQSVERRARARRPCATSATPEGEERQHEERVRPAAVVAQVVEARREEQEVEVRQHRRDERRPAARRARPGARSSERARTEPARPWVIVSMRGRMIQFGGAAADADSAPMADQSLQGKVALLTGASSGWDARSPWRSPRAGAKVFLVARREEKLREVVAGDHRRPAARPPTTSSTCASCRRSTTSSTSLLSRFRRLDILDQQRRPRLSARRCSRRKRSEIAEMIETNLAAAIYLTQACLHALLQSAPSDIVNISSIARPRGLRRRHGLLRRQGRARRLHARARRGAEARQHPRHRDLPRLGRHRLLRPVPPDARPAPDALGPTTPCAP